MEVDHDAIMSLSANSAQKDALKRGPKRAQLDVSARKIRNQGPPAASGWRF
jgi:hypothetical protein